MQLFFFHLCGCTYRGYKWKYVFVCMCIGTHTQGLHMDIHACLDCVGAHTGVVHRYVCMCGHTYGGCTRIYIHVCIVWMHVSGLHEDIHACACRGPMFMLRICLYWSPSHLAYHQGMLSSSNPELVRTVGLHIAPEIPISTIWCGDDRQAITPKCHF